MNLEYKNIGETTSDFATRLRKKLTFKKSYDQKLTFTESKKIAICGKLDPMAHGLVTILIDENTKLMSQYLNSIKVYKFTICGQFSTDSDDVMGLITEIDPLLNNNSECIGDLVWKYSILNNVSDSGSNVSDSNINNVNDGCLIQPYHHFSAINIIKNGIRKPLHYWYLHNQLDESEIPSKSVTIYDLIQCPNVIINDYQSYVMGKLDCVDPIHASTFRIDDIKKRYNECNIPKTIVLNQFIITVSSGFYIRMISKFLRQNYGICCHISDIERIDIFN